MLQSVKPKIEHSDARPLNLYSREYGRKTKQRPSIVKMSTKEETIIRSIKGDPLTDMAGPFYASIKGKSPILPDSAQCSFHYDHPVDHSVGHP